MGAMSTNVNRGKRDKNCGAQKDRAKDAKNLNRSACDRTGAPNDCPTVRKEHHDEGKADLWD
jgi:hypothetical protein